VQSLEAGRLTTAGGKDLKTVHHTLREPATITVRVPLSRKGTKALRSKVRKHQRLTLNVHVTLKPQRKGESSSSAVSKVAFKR
jgi:hypothetical protein